MNRTLPCVIRVGRGIHEGLSCHLGPTSAVFKPSSHIGSVCELAVDRWAPIFTTATCAQVGLTDQHIEFQLLGHSIDQPKDGGARVGVSEFLPDRSINAREVRLESVELATGTKYSEHSCISSLPCNDCVVDHVYRASYVLTRRMSERLLLIRHTRLVLKSETGDMPSFVGHTPHVFFFFAVAGMSEQVVCLQTMMKKKLRISDCGARDPDG